MRITIEKIEKMKPCWEHWELNMYFKGRKWVDHKTILNDKYLYNEEKTWFGVNLLTPENQKRYIKLLIETERSRDNYLDILFTNDDKIILQYVREEELPINKNPKMAHVNWATYSGRSRYYYVSLYYIHGLYPQYKLISNDITSTINNLIYVLLEDEKQYMEARQKKFNLLIELIDEQIAKEMRK
jgi:hypothetical protein